MGKNGPGKHSQEVAKARQEAEERNRQAEKERARRVEEVKKEQARLEQMRKSNLPSANWQGLG